MPTEVQRLDDLHAVRRYVNETLCEKDQLEADLFPLSERILVRGGAVRRILLPVRSALAVPDCDLGNGRQHDFVLRFSRRAIP